MFPYFIDTTEEPHPGPQAAKQEDMGFSYAQ